MTSYKSEFLQIMEQRGFIHQTSDKAGLDDLFLKNKVSAYIGFDPTAASLHAGGLIQIMMLYWLQKTGHQPIILMGGGTGMVGDPSFKNEARKILSEKEIEKNVSSIKDVFSRYLNFEAKENRAICINNKDWLHPLKYLPFLRDVGRHFSVNRMLSFDSVKSRLEREHSLSFLEFNYMILQAYDFVELYKNYNVRLQMGGSDQWGNIINGIELGHRMGTEQLYALTSPLLTTSSGVKMGKSLNGAVWLNEDLFSVYDFWQYWRNTEDSDLIRFLKLYTTLPLEEIERYSKVQGAELNEIKKIFATEVTALLHGREKAEAAALTAKLTFENKELDSNLPSFFLKEEELQTGIGILNLLVSTNLAKSNAEARRHIQARAIKLNDLLITDEKYFFQKSDLQEKNVAKLSFGKKKHILLKI